MKFKSLFAIAAMALLTVNCVQEEAGPLETTVKVEAVMENELSTKTNVDETGYFTWAKEDQIGIHTNAGDFLVGKLDKDSHGQSTGVFSYTYFGDAPVLSGVAVYPHNDNHAIADNKLTFVMPAEYNLGAVYTNTNAAMLAMNPVKKDGSASYSFSHLAGVMRFEFKNAPVGTSKFTLSLGGKKINGAFEVDLSNPVITTGEATDEQKTTTLNFTALEEVQNLVLFVPVPAGEYTGIEAKLYAGEEELGKWGAATAKNDIKKRSLVLMAAITFGEVPGGIENNVNVATAKQLTEAVAKGGTITLTEDISLTEILVVSKDITLDGNGHKITSSATRAINVSGAADVTIKNLTIVASGERAINVIQNTKKVTVDNVIATAANYTVNIASSAPNAVVAIKNSTLNGLCAVNVSAAGANVTVDNSVVNCNDNNTTAGESYAALCLNKEAIGGSIVATNSTINVTDGSDSVKGRNGAENGTVTIDDSSDDVLFIVAVITYEGSPYYHGFPTIAAAVEFAKENGVITLIRDITVAKPVTINKSITLDGNGKTLTYSGSDRAIEMPNVADADYDVTIKNLKVAFSGNYSQRGINYNDNGKLTLENVTVNEAGKNVTYALNLPGSSDNANVIINNSSLTGNIALNVWGENLTITADNSNFTSVDGNKGEGYSAIVLNNDGSTIADGTTVYINGGTITALDENGKQASAVRNSTNTGKVEISAETVVNGLFTRPVAIVTYDNTDNFYSCVSLQAAIDKAIETNAASVKLIANVAVSELIKIESPVVIDLNGMKVTAECKKAFEVHANATIKNGTIEAQQRCVDTRKAVELNLEGVTLIADDYTEVYKNPQPLTIGGSENGTKVTITNSTISAKAGYGIISFVKTETIVENTNISGYNALYVKPGSDDSTFEFINSTLTGSTGDNDVEGNSFTTIAVRANNVTVTADAESEIKAVGNYYYALSFGGQASGEETTTGNTATIAATITGNILANACAEANTIKVKAEYAENLKEAGYAVSEPVDGFVQVVTLMERDLAFSSTSVNVTYGQEFTLPTLSGEKTGVKYSSSNTAVATVHETTGAITYGTTVGATTITAYAEANETHLAGEASYTLTVAKATRTLSFSGSTASATYGDMTINVPSLSGDVDGVVFSSSKESVATVANDGTVTLVGGGETTITATLIETATHTGASASYTLTVAKATRTLEFSVGTVSATYGESFTAPTLTGDVDGVSFSSSTPGVATVNNKGEVTLVAGGTAKITATLTETATHTGASAYYTLTVKEKAVIRINNKNGWSDLKITIKSGSTTLVSAQQMTNEDNNIFVYKLDPKYVGTEVTYYLEHSWYQTSTKTVTLATENSATATTLNTTYLQPNDWNSDSPRYGAHIWITGQNGIWKSAVKVKDGFYEVELPEGNYTNIIWCRMDPNNTTNNWNSVWNQTGDLTLQHKCYCIQGSDAWDKPTKDYWY